ncbi:uncharacterized protein LOC128961578 [Oppia nitens]|uniref:uncharacterized protein LOC128961578 n=1 Tax=Oppia nitens TaxID=1686743 RepID=UPI0023DC588F|nr:uncharacterized protein LOC128961578 [Oppia nitens]
MQTTMSSQFVTQDNVVFVKGLPVGCDVNSLKKLFSFYGNVKYVKINANDTQPVAFVTYDTIKSADEAIKATNGYPFNGFYLNVSKARRNMSKVTENIADNCSGFNPKISIVTTAKWQVINWLNQNKDNLDSKPQHKQDICNKSKDFVSQLVPNINSNLQQTSNLEKSLSPTVENVEEVSHYVSDVTISEIYEDLLAQIFDYLPMKQLFSIQRVCTLWQSVVKSMLKYQKVITFGIKPSVTCSDPNHKSNEFNDLTDAIREPNGSIYLKNIEKLAPIIRPMESIECLHVANCRIDTIALKWLINSCPNITCLRFVNIEGLLRTDWPKFMRSLCSKITHFSYAGNTLNEWKSLSTMVSSFPLLEELVISDCIQDLKHVFQGIGIKLYSLSIENCDRLTPQAFYSLKQMKSSEIQFLFIDLINNYNCLSIIHAIYESLPNLQHLRAVNIGDKEIKCFIHDKESNKLSILIKEATDDWNEIIKYLAKDVEFLEITGPLFADLFKEFSQQFPNCNQLKLNGCLIWCNCELKKQDIIDGCEYSCSDCYKQLLQNVFIAKINVFDLNNKEYAWNPKVNYK